MQGGHWGSQQVRPVETVDYVAHVLDEVLGMDLQERPEEPLQGFELSAYHIGPFAWARGLTDGALRIQRGRRRIREDGDQFYFLYQTLGPPSPHRRGDFVHVVRPGELLLGHSASGFECLAPEGYSNRMLWIPKALLAPLLQTPDIDVGQIIDPAASRLVWAGLNTLWSQAPELDGVTAAANLHGMMGLIAAAAGAHRRGYEVVQSACRDALAQRARQFVERHFWRGDLSPAMTAQALGISVRQLHRVFAPTGVSFAEVVASRRVERARWLLSNPAFVHTKVAEIAHRCGFDSLATFHRAFRAEYGCAPGELRDACLAPTLRSVHGRPFN